MLVVRVLIFVIVVEFAQKALFFFGDVEVGILQTVKLNINKSNMAKLIFDLLHQFAHIFDLLNGNLVNELLFS